jgi:hypothetical protein
MVVLPMTALLSFEKKLSLVFSNPLSRLSFFSFENKPKNAIFLGDQLALLVVI